jgi:hypothetical protein
MPSIECQAQATMETTVAMIPSAPGIRPQHILLIVATLAVCLAADAGSGFAAQTVISTGVWGVWFYLLGCVRPEQRFTLIACLVIATAGEIFLSLVWGLYTYRLGNIPPFVPPAHVLLLLLGISLARKMPEAVALAIIGCAAVYTLVAAATGFDTLGVPMFLLLAAASLAMPHQRRLYASTFVLSLALELYGTWLGIWTWEHDVPGFTLVTTNPPGAAGSLYCVLDALVAMAALLFGPRIAAGPVRQVSGMLPPNAAPIYDPSPPSA